MAMRLFVMGQKAVLKESGGKFFLSKAVGWTDNPAARPAAVKARNEKFKRAVATCKTKSKYKGGTVWGVSEYNKCIAEILKKE